MTKREDLLRMVTHNPTWNTQAVGPKRVADAAALEQKIVSPWTSVLFLQITPIGSRDDTLYLASFEDGSSYARTGCFLGTLDEFEHDVRQAIYKDTPYTIKARQRYLDVIQVFRAVAEVHAERFHSRMAGAV